MTIDIPNDYEDILRQAVASGAFANPEDALRRALELFAAEQSDAPAENNEQQKHNRWNKRNTESIQQSRQRLSKPLDEAAVIHRLHARLADQETRN